MKVKILFALSALLMLGSVSLNAQEVGNSSNNESTTQLEGDLNHDNKVDVADVTYLVNIIMNQSTSVDIPVTSVSVSPTSKTINVGSTSQLTATVSPSTATNKTVTWSSSNQAIATVSTNGLVTAKAAGTATITVETENGGYTATCEITVNPTSQTTYYWYAGTTLPTASNISTIARGSLTSKPSWTESNQQDCTVTNNTGESSYIYYCFPANWNVTFYDGNNFSVGLSYVSNFTYNNINYKVERLGRKQVAQAIIPLFARC